MRTFEGTSENGSLQEALNKAIESALETIGRTQTDAMVSYGIDEIRGQHGGIATIKKLTIVIAVK